MSDFWYEVGVPVVVSFGAVILGLAFIFGIAMGMTALLGSQSCRALHENAGITTQWSFWGGCYVTMPDGRIVPEEIYLKDLTVRVK